MSYGSRVAWIAPVLLWLLAAAVYWGAQDNQNLTEDARVVWANPAVSGDDLRGTLLGRYEYDPDETRDAVRPVATLANRIRHEVLGTERAPYVWVQVTLHALCGTLLCLLVLSTIGSPPAALLSGVLFVAHPVLTSSVLGLAGIAEQLSLAFCLLSLWSLNAVLREPLGRGRAAVVAGALLALAIGSKEIAFLLLPVTLLSILAARPSTKGLHDSWRGRLLVGFLGVGVLGLTFRLVSLAALSAASRATPAVHPDTGWTFMSRTGIGLAAAWTNLSLLIYPHGLSYTYDFLPARLQSSFGLLWTSGGGLLLALTATSIFLAIRGKVSGTLWVSFLAFSLLGSLGFVAPIGDFLNERTAYFLLPALLGTLSWGVTEISIIYKHRWIDVSISVVAVAAAAVLGVLTTRRVADYTNQDALIRSSIMASGSAQAHYDLGNQLLGRGQYDSAQEQYEAALEKNPELWMAWINIGAAFSREEDYSLAMRAYTKALEGAGDRPAYRAPMAKAHFNRAILLMRQDRNAEAAEDLLKTLEVFPDHLRAHANLAFIFRNSDKFDEQAIYHFRRAIELEPDPESKASLEEAMDYIYERQEKLEREKRLRINAGQSPESEEGGSGPQ